MAQPADKVCSHCSEPLSQASASGICHNCRSALFSLATETPPADTPDPPLSNDTARTETWPRIEGVLSDRDYVRELGVGGMGSVSLLKHRRLDRYEALKVLLPKLADSPRFVERFLRESKVLARLRHPNIVTIYDCSEADDILYILMDYIDGGTLKEAISSDILDLSKRIDIITQLASGLAYAHQEGVIHRDIKPANILLTQSGYVKIADFGLSKQAATADSHLSVTRPQEAMGTLAYMAPEQQNGESSGDTRSDVYSLGVLCYELFTRRRPQGVFRRPSAEVAVSQEVDEVILRALEHDPNSRFADAQEFLEAWQSAAKGALTQQPSEAVPLGAARARPQRKLRKIHLFLAAAVLTLSLPLFLFLFLPESFSPSSKNKADEASDPKSPIEIEGTANLAKEFIVPDIGMRLKWVPPGEVILGANEAGDTDASPPLTIELTYGFWMGIHEVTQIQYVNLMGTNPSQFSANESAATSASDETTRWRHRPVDSVTWREAATFCDKLTEENRRAGLIPANFRYRLPTEIEWEYVCRAGNRSVSPGSFTAVEIQPYAWTYQDAQEIERTQPVGTKKPNEWGFYDMLGNVSEYCLNGWWYYPDYEDQEIRDWVSGSKQGDRIYRGGSFAQEIDRAIPYKRSSNALDERDLAQGFRVVLSEEFPFVSEMLNSAPPHGIEFDSLGLSMTWIPSGRFVMGEASPSTPRGPSVFPPTPTAISEGFWMSVTEVTTFQWDRVANDDLSWLLQQASTTREASNDLPKVDVSWIEATNFCHKLTFALNEAGRIREGYVVRLPTEAEWEWACRREHPTLYAFGNDPRDLGIDFGSRARFKDNGENRPGPVTEKTAGQSGLKGMYGNVREWCLDWRQTYAGLEQTDPFGLRTSFDSEAASQEKVLRGGDFLSEAAVCTGTARTFARPQHRSPQVGFRIVFARPLVINEDSLAPSD